MCLCGKCSKMCGWLVLIVGVLFLLKDLNVWNLWGIEWYTAVFLLAGLAMIGRGCCKDCQCVCETPAKKSKK